MVIRHARPHTRRSRHDRPTARRSWAAAARSWPPSTSRGSATGCSPATTGRASASSTSSWPTRARHDRLLRGQDAARRLRRRGTTTCTREAHAGPHDGGGLAAPRSRTAPFGAELRFDAVGVDARRARRARPARPPAGGVLSRDRARHHVRHRRRRGPPRLGRGRHPARACRRSRSSGSPTRRSARRASACGRRWSTPASSSRSKRITVNLAPAYLRKIGPGFDLPLGVALLVASDQLEPEARRGTRDRRRAVADRRGAADPRRARDRRGRAAASARAARCCRARGRARRRWSRASRCVGDRVADRGGRRARAATPSRAPLPDPPAEAGARPDARPRRRARPERAHPRRSRSRRPAATTCSCTARPAPARRCSRAGCRRSCRR